MAEKYETGKWEAVVCNGFTAVNVLSSSNVEELGWDYTEMELDPTGTCGLFDGMLLDWDDDSPEERREHEEYFPDAFMVGARILADDWDHELSNDEVRVRVIHGGVGAINESDVLLASTANAIIVGFNVRPDKTAIDSAKRQSVDIRTYRIIYECIDEIKAAMAGMLAPTFREELEGHAEVRQTIHVPNVGTIAGCYVQDGKVTRKAQIRIVRDGIVIFEDKISSLRRFKDDVKEVASGYECGIGIEKFNDIKVGDILEAYEMVEVKREV